LLGKKIAKLRKERGVTQKDLANAIGISESYIAAIEEGKAYPRIKTLVLIAKCLGVGLELLME
jgi:Predicted transcriptional regulator with C-terminal CBS domains